MDYNPKKYNRRTTRLKGYDYSSPGRYFVTMCTHNRVCLFGEINDGKMTLNEWGRIAREQWLETESIRSIRDHAQPRAWHYTDCRSG